MSSQKHIVFIINLGGGPEAFIKNLLPLFQTNACRISLLIKSKVPIPKQRFDPFFQVYIYNTKKSWKSLAIQYLKGGGILSHWVYKLFKREEEKEVIKVLKHIEKDAPIDVIEITEGFGMVQLQKHWKVITRAHGSDWSFRMFCHDQVNVFDSAKRALQKTQHLHSNANFSISAHTRDHLTKELKLPKGLIEFRPYPIPLKHFQDAPKAIITEVSDDAPVVLSIGRIEKRKGMDVLVKAMLPIWQKNPEVRLVLLGSEAGLSIGALRAMIPSEYQHLLVHPGFIPYNEIPSYYKRATLYVSASQYETFGYTLLEAMAAGTPVICTDRGAMPELITHQHNGWLVPFGDDSILAKAIQELISNPEQRESFVQYSYERIKNYDLHILGKQIVEDWCHERKKSH